MPEFAQRPRDDVRSPGTRVTGGCKSPYGCWESNPGPFEEQLVLLIPEPLLRALVKFFLMIVNDSWHYVGTPCLFKT